MCSFIFFLLFLFCFYFRFSHCFFPPLSTLRLVARRVLVSSRLPSLPSFFASLPPLRCARRHRRHALLASILIVFLLLPAVCLRVARTYLPLCNCRAALPLSLPYHPFPSLPSPFPRPARRSSLRRSSPCSFMATPSAPSRQKGDCPCARRPNQGATRNDRTGGLSVCPALHCGSHRPPPPPLSLHPFAAGLRSKGRSPLLSSSPPPRPFALPPDHAAISQPARWQLRALRPGQRTQTTTKSTQTAPLAHSETLRSYVCSSPFSASSILSSLLRHSSTCAREPIQPIFCCNFDSNFLCEAK